MLSVRYIINFIAIACICLLFPSNMSMAKEITHEKKITRVHKKTQLVRPKTMNIMIDKSVPITFYRPASTIFIANPEIADIQVLSANSVMVFGKKAGQTTLIITDNVGKKIVYRSIVVSQNLAQLRRSIRTILPGSNIKVSSVPNGIALTGIARDASSVEDARRLASRYLPESGGDIINRIKVRANNQIQIKVRFAEVSKDIDKRFGINWESLGSAGQFALGMATGADFYTAGQPILRTVMGDSTNSAITAGFRNSHFNINGMIDALAKDGFVTILAEPSLTALSGQTASFLAGGEFPVPVPQSSDTISIEWKQYGVSLAFTPTIINGDRINLHVRPEVSQLSDIGSIKLSNITIPSLVTRRAETTIELNSGQSFALAGLLNNKQTQSIEKFPFLGDIPILGQLFRSSRFQNNETELVIIITPYIVKPTTEENLSLPTDGIIAPTDSEFFFEGRNIGKNKNARKLSGNSRAIKVKNPKAENNPAPLAAPIKKVRKKPIKVKAVVHKKKKNKIKKKILPIPSKKPRITKRKTKQYPMSKHLISKTKAPEPKGLGGFIVE